MCILVILKDFVVFLLFLKFLGYFGYPRLVLRIMKPGAVEKKWGHSLKKKKNHWKITLYTVCATKLQIKLLYSIFSNKTYSIDNMTNPFNLSCDIDDRKYGFYNFNFENFLQGMRLWQE